MGKIGELVKGLRAALAAAPNAGEEIEIKPEPPENSEAGQEREFRTPLRFTERAASSLVGQVSMAHDVREALSHLVAAHGSQKSVADWLGVSKAYLGDILHGRRPVSDAVAARMGWRKIEVFVKGGPES